MSERPPRPIFVLALRPDRHVDGLRALKAAIKLLGRRFGLKVVSIREQRDDERDAA